VKIGNELKASRGFILATVLAAGLWNIILVVAATFNANWVLTRVDGGQFHSLPMGLRFANFGFTVLTLWVILFAWRLWKFGGAKTTGDARWAKLVVIMYALSTLVNLISRSPAERLNAIPAAIIVGGFILLSRPKR
jgi:hypothetical protein